MSALRCGSVAASLVAALCSFGAFNSSSRSNISSRGSSNSSNSSSNSSEEVCSLTYYAVLPLSNAAFILCVLLHVLMRRLRTFSRSRRWSRARPGPPLRFNDAAVTAHVESTASDGAELTIHALALQIGPKSKLVRAAA